MKIALTLEYDGTHYFGWQSQPDRNSVQAEVEKALSAVADAPLRVICAGRTDTGVHALGQVLHFETSAKRKPIAWVLGVNTHLPNDISIRSMRVVDEAFHARYSATQRHYQYIIYNRPTRSALWDKRMAWACRPLDAEAMHAAGQYLVGEHDFSAFRASGCQAKTPIRQLSHLSVKRQGPMIVVDISANAFLHHMVRNIMGVLMHIGRGEAPAAWAGEVLASCDRTQAANTAPACGLYLVKVDYPGYNISSTIDEDETP